MALVEGRHRFCRSPTDCCLPVAFDKHCGVLISAKLIYGISMHVIYCSCVNGSNLDQSLVILHNWRRGWDPK